MKKYFILFCAAIIFNACSGSVEELHLRKAPELKLTSSIIYDGGHCRLIMNFQNLSADTVRLSNPECFNINVFLTIWNEAGDALDQTIRIRPFCGKPLAKIDPNTTGIYPIERALDSLYTLTPGEKYTVQYEYNGGFYDGNEELYYKKGKWDSEPIEFTYSNE